MHVPQNNCLITLVTVRSHIQICSSNLPFARVCIHDNIVSYAFVFLFSQTVSTISMVKVMTSKS